MSEVRLLGLCIAAGSIVSCGAPSEPPSSMALLDGSLGIPEVVQIGGKATPRAYTSVHWIPKEGLQTAILELDGEYSVSFVPVTQSIATEPNPATRAEAQETRAAASATTTSTRIHVQVVENPGDPENATEKAPEVAAITPVHLDLLRGSRRLLALADPVRVDLKRYAEKRIALRWSYDAPADLRVGLVDVRLVQSRVAAGETVPAEPSWNEGTSGRPVDVLLICSDTHRTDHVLGPRGRELMPELGSALAGAVAYPQATSTASWTMPSVASVLTGLFPRYHLAGRLAGTVPVEEFEEQAVPPGHFGFRVGDRYRILSSYPRALPTLAERLRPLGYRTAIVASNPLYMLSGVGLDGFDLAIDAGVVRGDEVNAAARAVLETTPQSQPLFLLVHYMEPHQWKPWYYDALGAGSEPSQAPDAVRESYARAVRDVDRSLGELLRLWDARRDRSRSLVMFFSDHGEHLHDPDAPPRLGHGNSMHEILLRVPLLVQYPAWIAPDVTRSNSLPSGLSWAAGPADWTRTALVDIVPTVLEVVGLDVPEGLSGMSLLDPRHGPGAEQRYLFADFQLYGDSLSAVRHRRHKLVINLSGDDRRLVEVLAAPRDGIWQQELAGEKVDADEQLRQLMATFRRYEVDAAERTRDLQFLEHLDQQEAMERLRSLGYVR